MKRSSRVIKPSARYSDGEEGSSVARKRCECAGCPFVAPICFARSSESCVGNRWTSRWYHISQGEHYCNECFEYFYRSHRDGYAEYAQWKLLWSTKSRGAPSVRGYLSMEMLPYWAQCQNGDCRRWRQVSRDVDLSPEFIQSFQCGTTHQRPNKKPIQDGCSVPEDERVEFVRGPTWLSLCRYIPYLQNCPASPFLTAYYPDGVGLSPTEEHKKTKDKYIPHQQPFPTNLNLPLHALGFTPDMMTLPEIEAFPLLAKEAPYLYLGLRNLILVLWALDPKEWLTKERCERVVICRGLARVYSIELLPLILRYLTHTQTINVGLVSPPTQLLSQITNTQDSVLVIGAGISGLAAAYTLRCHGYQVTVLEGKGHLGGRLGPSSDWSKGHVVTGVTNNPLALMAVQTGSTLQTVKSTCPLMTSIGKTIDAKTDRRIEFHYNAILDIVSDWRKGRGKHEDVNLAAKIQEFHQQFIRESQQYFNDEEEWILKFHLCNLEFASGCSVDRLSSLYWDHNENLPQFAGDHVVFPEGFSLILDRLADGLDIRFNHKVTTIDYNTDKVIVKTDDGKEFKAKKVVVSLPLGVLKTTNVHFLPDLPSDKRLAIESMGSGTVEMVVLKFHNSFWSKSGQGHRMFGRVPSDDDQHGVFNIFQGISHIKTGDDDNTSSGHLLISYIVGSAKVENILSKPDEEIVSLYMDTLRSMFSSKNIPDPFWSLVTRWSRDPLAGMSYSFLPVGCDGSLYDLLAQEVEEKIFFAGEATSRQFPQTVTGAFMSGVREARKIIQWD